MEEKVVNLSQSPIHWITMFYNEKEEDLVMEVKVTVPYSLDYHVLRDVVEFTYKQNGKSQSPIHWITMFYQDQQIIPQK